MGTTGTQWIVILGVLVAILIALVVWHYYRQKQSRRLQGRFGPEYARTVGDLGSQSKAESELKARERRVERLDIAPLSPAEAARFTELWSSLQGRFVDNPQGVVVQAGCRRASGPGGSRIDAEAWLPCGRL